MNFWLDPDEGNEPIAYLGSITSGRRSTYLVSLFRSHVEPDRTILEVGCNAGRNLFYLWNARYRNLAGVEINPKAARFAQLAFEDHDVDIHVGDIHDLDLPRFDVVYTMAVMEHLPDEDILKKMSDLARETLITIEDEVTNGPRHFPRNYQDIFEPFGWKQVYFTNAVPGVNRKFFGRVFKR